MIGDDENGKGQPGDKIGSALLLSPEEAVTSADSEKASDSDEILYACTLVLSREQASSNLTVSALAECTVEEQTFPLQHEQLAVLVNLIAQDLQVSKIVTSLAEVLTSQER